MQKMCKATSMPINLCSMYIAFQGVYRSQSGGGGGATLSRLSYICHNTFTKNTFSIITLAIIRLPLVNLDISYTCHKLHLT